MNARSLLSKIGLVAAAAVVLGTLAALPAQAREGNTQIKVTHAPKPYKSAVQPVAPTSAKAQPKVSQPTPAEIQVGVMAKSPAQPAVRRSIYIRR
jgi:hypothetical protein